MEIRAGTSGYSYKEWKGELLPAKIAPARCCLLRERLAAVEINNTFYRMPRREVVESWASSVPESFRFAVKVSQRITHRKRLADVEDELDYLLDSSRRSAAARHAARAAAAEPAGRSRAPRALPRPPRRARARGVRVPPRVVARRARASRALRDRGAALVASETDEAPAALHETARFGYLRLRRTDYRPAISPTGSRACAARVGRGVRVLQARGVGTGAGRRSLPRSRSAAARSRCARDARARGRLDASMPLTAGRSPTRIALLLAHRRRRSARASGPTGPRSKTRRCACSSATSSSTRRNPPGNERIAADFFAKLFARDGIESQIYESAPAARASSRGCRERFEARRSC
jgi:uncharacterized protein YecE (DUF72 family)